MLLGAAEAAPLKPVPLDGEAESQADGCPQGRCPEVEPRMSDHQLSCHCVFLPSRPLCGLDRLSYVSREPQAVRVVLVRAVVVPHALLHELAVDGIAMPIAGAVDDPDLHHLCVEPSCMRRDRCHLERHHELDQPHRSDGITRLAGDNLCGHRDLRAVDWRRMTEEVDELKLSGPVGHHEGELTHEVEFDQAVGVKKLLPIRSIDDADSNLKIR
jgi:hypothetical protein